MGRWYGLSGLMLWLVGVATIWLLGGTDVRRECVPLTLADGTPIHGVLYRKGTLPPTQPMPAAVVLHGTAMSHQSCEPGLSLSLAECGIAVLAVDLRGHGRSDGSLPKSWFDDLDRILELPANQQEAAAGLQYLQALPWVDAKRISLVGHSLGALAAVSTAYPRQDVASVVSISVAPLICDARSPRNLLLLAGDCDRLISPARYDTSIRRATGSAPYEAGVLFGTLETGTGRECCFCRGVSHLSALFDPSTARRAVQWVGYSAAHDPGPVPGGRLMGTGCAVLLAVLGGAAACTMVLKALTNRLPAASEMNGPGRRARIPLLLCVVAGPIAAVLGDWLPTGPVLFAGPTVVLFALLALIWLGAGRGRLARAGERETGRLPNHSKGIWAGTGIGLLSCVLGVLWFGLPFGATWLDLLPCGRRATLGLVLVLLLFPCTLGLACALRRALPGKGSGFAAARGIAWLAIPAAVWLGNELCNRRHPFFGIAVSLFAAAFLVPLPLWLLPDRKGMSLARAISHAASVAWLLACHLPFVHAG
jgi:pimeloyl-ACP methyl ester carboxylesterase